MTHDEVNDLMARMRTCAAFLVSRPQRNSGQAWVDAFSGTEDALNDAAALLIEAASMLEQLAPPPDLGPPMEIIKPLPAQPIQKKIPELSSAFVDPGVAPRNLLVSRNACPKCDSRANKIVHRGEGNILLECPVCGARWKYHKAGKAEWR